MADFVQTMKDWRRMCMAMEKLHPIAPCCGCPLEEYGCPAIYEDNSHVDYSDVEKKVAAWAAEHQEQSYPTWEEWLSDKYNLAYNDDFRLAMSREHIPADDAQKLGIEPRDGT